MKRAMCVSVCLLCLVIISATTQAGVVYDNTATAVTGDFVPQLTQGFWPFSLYNPYEPQGDEVCLAGNERTVTQFSVVLLASRITSLDRLTLDFRANDGADVMGDPGAPGSLIWTTTLTNVTVNTAPTIVTVTVPNVTVPDKFTWLASSDSMDAGLATYDSPTIGSSADGFWDLDQKDFSWYPLWFNQTPVANFGAQVVAVPEPATILLLTMALPLLRRRA